MNPFASPRIAGSLPSRYLKALLVLSHGWCGSKHASCENYYLGWSTKLNQCLSRTVHAFGNFELCSGFVMMILKFFPPICLCPQGNLGRTSTIGPLEVPLIIWGFNRRSEELTGGMSNDQLELIMLVSSSRLATRAHQVRWT